MKILTNSNIIYGEIEKLLENSKQFVYLVSPYIEFEIKDHDSYEKFTNAINLAIKNNVKVNFISRQPDLYSKRDLEGKLKDFIEKGCNLYLVPNLHTKIYCNESKALISSMNLYMHSVINNEEIGVKIGKKHEMEEFEKILYYIYKLKLKSNRSNEIKIEPYSKMEESFDIEKNKEYIYVLKLENKNWWVGKSKNPLTRIAAHKDGMGSSWTQDNKVIAVKEIIEEGNLTEITISYMKEYGWKNIRGTCFNEMYEKYIPKKIREFVSEEKKKLNEEQDSIKIFKFEDEEKYLIYVLKLENNKWWVGKSTNLSKIVKKYKNGKGPPWTLINKVIDVEEVRENADLKEVTLEYMRKYGWENVRGYAWSQWNMRNPPKELRNNYHS